MLDDLAQFADNPSALPWHGNLREGTTQLTDSLSGPHPGNNLAIIGLRATSQAGSRGVAAAIG